MSSQHIGTFMIAAAFALGIGLMTIFFGDVLDERRNPNQAPSSSTEGDDVVVTLTANAQHHYVTTGSINGQSVEFLLDTGATVVVVPEGIARQLRLPRGMAGRAMTANGAVTVYATVLDSVAIGDMTLRNVSASINPAMDPGQVLLGMSALSRVEFVQRGDSLTLRQTRRP